MTFAARYRLGVFLVFAALSIFLTGAGGLGLSSSVGFIGLLTLPFLAVPGWRAARAAPLPLALGAAAIAWFCITHAWSAHPRADEVYKLALLTPLYVAAVYAGVRMGEDEARFARPLLLAGALALGVFFAIEALAGLPIAVAFQDWLHDLTDPEGALGIATRRLSRGATAFIMLAGPAGLWFWLKGGYLHRAAALCLLAASAIAASGFGVEANILALVGGLGAMAFALRWPRMTLQVILTGAAIAVLISPLIIGALVAFLPDSVAERLPLSWHWRLEIWGFALERIAEAPLLGQGLDAGRTLSETILLRGVEIERMPIHAHNAGLHIWMETGAVGAMLAAGTLLALARSAGRAALGGPLSAGLAFAGSVWMISVMLGYGVWQEWHHGALAFALGSAFILLRARG
ncbi:O-antigen ligase family protein [Hyphomonadaceae bacterium ML37]|nr:O-antigen ligase family protein [Hyphomonadaceae bacterium ML37]